MIVYVVFSVTLNALFGNLTQSVLTWEVGFQDGSVIGESFGTNQIVVIDQTKTVYLIVSYTGLDVSSVPSIHSRALFVLNYVMDKERKTMYISLLVLVVTMLRSKKLFVSTQPLIINFFYICFFVLLLLLFELINL